MQSGQSVRCRDRDMPKCRSSGLDFMAWRALRRASNPNESTGIIGSNSQPDTVRADAVALRSPSDGPNLGPSANQEQLRARSAIHLPRDENILACVLAGRAAATAPEPREWSPGLIPLPVSPTIWLSPRWFNLLGLELLENLPLLA